MIFALILVCVYVIGAGLLAINHGEQIRGLKMLIGGSFFFLILYAAQWLTKN